MTGKPLTEDELQEVNALLQLSDDDIDTSDIPVITGEQWMLAQRGNLYRPVKKSVTIRLDADVIDWFKSHSENSGYQTEINRILRQHVIRSERITLDTASGTK